MHDYDAYCDKPGKLHLPELGYRPSLLLLQEFSFRAICVEPLV